MSQPQWPGNPPGAGRRVPPHQQPPQRGPVPPPGSSRRPAPPPAQQSLRGQLPPPPPPSSSEEAPQRPGAVLAAAALGGVTALVVLGVAVHTLVAGLAGASGGGEVAVVLLALIVGSVGAAHALGVYRLLHPRSPDTGTMALAGWTTVAVTGFGVVRSVRGRGDGPDPLTLLVWGGLAAVVIALLVLITRPSVTRWVQARARGRG